MGSSRAAHAVHIFTRLGMWANQLKRSRFGRSFARLRAMRHRDATEAEECTRSIHGLLVFTGSPDAEAKENCRSCCQGTRKTNPELESSRLTAGRYSNSLRVRANDWAAAAALTIPNLPHWSSFPFLEALIEYGHALERAHTGDLDGAPKSIARMQQLREATKSQSRLFQKSSRPEMQAASHGWLQLKAKGNDQ